MASSADRTGEPAQRLPPSAGAENCAVLFADVAGSTKLYEALGDKLAKKLVDEVLAALTIITRRHGGRVIKTIGDEAMCVFASAERSFYAAIDIRQKIDTMPVVSGSSKRRIRIGFHAGPVIEEKGDVFGDTVNTAARMSGLARHG